MLLHGVVFCVSTFSFVQYFTLWFLYVKGVIYGMVFMCGMVGMVILYRMALGYCYGSGISRGHQWCLVRYGIHVGTVVIT